MTTAQTPKSPNFMASFTIKTTSPDGRQNHGRTPDPEIYLEEDKSSRIGSTQESGQNCLQNKNVLVKAEEM